MPHSLASSTVPARLRQTRSDPSLRREADMMAFYLAITLLVALNVPADQDPPQLAELLLIIWGTTLGLAVAHWFALTFSVYLVHDPGLHHTPAEMLFSQVVMALVLSVVGSAAVILTPVRFEMLSGRLAVALFVGVLVVTESRAGGRTTRTALGLGAVALGLAVGIATVKLALK